MVTDPISDFIIRLKNASDAKKASVVVIGSKLTENIAHVLKKAGYVSSVEKSKTKREIELGLVYFDGEPRINGVERISKPSRRLYQKAADIRSFKSGFGNTIFTTSKGIMTDADAKKSKLGGEILFKIW
jgi:small subunit ribosomal protein S8